MSPVCGRRRVVMVEFWHVRALSPCLHALSLGGDIVQHTDEFHRVGLPVQNGFALGPRLATC